MFSIGPSKEKISILETKFQIYEDLSKDMLDKLERAVNKISISNQSVALILERHENKFEQSDRADKLIMELIKDVKNDMEKVEKKVEDLTKFRWLTAGVAGLAIMIVGSAGFFANILSPGTSPQAVESKSLKKIQIPSEFK